MVASCYSQSPRPRLGFGRGLKQCYVMLRIITFLKLLGYTSSDLFHLRLSPSGMRVPAN